MTHEQWVELCLDQLVWALERCMCGQPVVPGEACAECGHGQVWVEDVEEGQPCAEQSC